MKYNIELLRHIQDEIIFIFETTNGKAKDIILSDGLICRAVIRSFEIIGEASKKLEDEFKAAHPHVKWKKIAGTRDRLIHDYFGVDYEIIWDIIENKLPDLKLYIDNIINEA